MLPESVYTQAHWILSLISKDLQYPRICILLADRSVQALGKLAILSKSLKNYGAMFATTQIIDVSDVKDPLCLNAVLDFNG